jgi:hypothetical protein
VRTRLILFLPILGGCAFLLPSLQTPPPCPTGTVLCNNLTCSDLRTDPFNCGFCENVCGQGLSCKNILDGGGLYDGGLDDAGIDVDAGTYGGSACLCTIPGGTYSNGACYNLDIDPTNCGQIGLSCAATQVCISGTCGCAGDDAGQIVVCTVDGGPVCANLDNDPHRCGGCDNDCGEVGYCNGGVCADAGLGDDGGLGDGGMTDAGLGDAGSTDGGLDDGGLGDGGLPDGGLGDAGDGGDGGP